MQFPWFSWVLLRWNGYSFHYLQIKEKQEVDLALVEAGKMEKIIELKYADAAVSPVLRYFSEKYQFPVFKLVQELKRERMIKR